MQDMGGFNTPQPSVAHTPHLDNFCSTALRSTMEEIDNEETAVQDFLQILEEHRKNCESQGKYVEAEIAKNRIHELRKHEQQRYVG
jgi:hypothetical protein